MDRISTLAVGVVILSQACGVQIEPQLLPGPWPRGAQVLANFSASPLGVSDRNLNLLDRQACGAGYGQCDYVGECCPTNGHCCGEYCLEQHPGIDCCSSYVCPSAWKCCGTIGTHCMPDGATCCSADGGYCPPQWSCCGNQGYCYPTEGFHCCSNNGIFCPNGAKCVYCSADSTEICCEGDFGIIPPFTHDNPTDTAIPTVPTTTRHSPSPNPTSAEPSSQSPIPSQFQSTPAPDLQYFSTTFTFTYIIWTHITFIEGPVDSTISTESTILTCLATDEADAAPTFSSLASSVQASANSAALAASPPGFTDANTPTSTSPAAQATGSQPDSGTKHSAAESINGSWVLGTAVTFVMLIFIM
ncbi:hypothetical protein F5884DRAFT_789739 [Xylogone sp. PMI_703]|nr:hypothetical protein F5884DRAFT_789739 [Xylogone sp. PMI_703]